MEKLELTHKIEMSCNLQLIDNASNAFAGIRQSRTKDGDLIANLSDMRLETKKT
jgi:hypothetical protein